MTTGNDLEEMYGPSARFSDHQPIWPNGAPGSEDWSQQEQERLVYSAKFVRNVTRP